MVTQSSVQETLRELIEVNRDAEKGFTEAAEKLENPSTAAEFRTFATERGRFANELVEIGQPVELSDEDGSIVASLHRAWIDLKDALTSGDHAILAAAEVGEDHAVEAYEEAMSRDLPKDVADVVERQFEQVKEAHDRVRMLRDATE